MHQVLFLFFVVVIVQTNLITCERPTRQNLTFFFKKRLDPDHLGRRAVR